MNLKKKTEYVQKPKNGHAKSLFGKYLHNSILYFRFIVPTFVGTRQLTMMTILWTILLFIFNDIWWAYGLLIFLQRITDTWDGAIGRERNEGYIKWGYFVDHFLDYIFLCSVMIALYFHFNDVWALYICLPISIYMLGFALSTSVLDDKYMPFIVITKNWWTSLDEIQFGIMLYIYLVFQSLEWLRLGFFGLTIFSINYIYNIQKKLAIMDIENIKNN